MSARQSIMPGPDDGDMNGHFGKRRFCPPSVCIPWVSANWNDHNRRKKLFNQMLRWSVILITLYWVGSYVHTETYVFQSTTLGDWIRPVRRTECHLVVHSYTGDDETSLGGRKLVRRRSLQMHHVPGKDETIYSNTTTATTTEAVLTKSNGKPVLSIALLFLYDGSPAGGNGNDGGQSWNEELMQRVIRNREEYASRHGYDLLNANAFGLVDKSRPAAWSKLRAMDHFLTHGRPLSNNNQQHQNQQPQHRRHRYYDYILYIDMDVVIMDLNRKLETFIDIATDGASGDSVEFIMTRDWNGPNTGIWLARGVRGDHAITTARKITVNASLSPSLPSSSSTGQHGSASEAISGTGVRQQPSLSFASWFLREAWAQGDALMQKTEKGTGRKHPFEYEQRAFHFLLGTPQWASRGLRKYRYQGQGHGKDEHQGKPAPTDSPLHDASLSEAYIRSHFRMFPQCAFNSYSLHPLDLRGSREESQYVHGSDFLVHFAGKKGRIKVYLMEHYLRIAEASYQHTKANLIVN